MKHNKKKLIIFSVTSLVLSFLILAGITYAYYRTRTIGNQNEKSVKATSKLLEVTYSDDNAVITASDIVPGYSTSKTFTIENTGNETVSYSIVLDKVANTFTRTSDWTFTISKNGKIIKENVKIPTNESYILNNETLAADGIDEYTLTIKYANLENEDQSIDMGKSLSFRINIDESTGKIFESAESGTLLAAIGNDNLIGKTLTTPGQEPSLDTEAILASAEDDYGTSYYFRGNVTNNYVTYSGMCWRIVRVQGNGTIKLVLADRDHVCSADVSANGDGTYSGYNSNNTTSAFIADPSVEEFRYDDIDVKYENSVSLRTLNAWINGGIYQYLGKVGANSFSIKEGTFIQNISNADQEKLVKAEWCNDTSVISKEFWDFDFNPLDRTDPSLIFYTRFRYGTYLRLISDTASPSLKCNNIGLDETKATKVSSNIGMLTADEVAFAGSSFGSFAYSYNHYLKTNATGEEYYTMSPCEYHEADSSPLMFQVQSNGSLGEGFICDDIAIRPAVVLRSDVTVTNDTNSEYLPGTQMNPYIIN